MEVLVDLEGMGQLDQMATVLGMDLELVRVEGTVVEIEMEVVVKMVEEEELGELEG